MLNRLFVLMGIFYSSTALAGYFDDYVPTLDRLYDLGLSPINSGYNLVIHEKNGENKQYIKIPVLIKNNWLIKNFYFEVYSNNEYNDNHYIGLRQGFDTKEHDWNDYSTYVGGALKNLGSDINADFYSNEVQSYKHNDKGSGWLDAGNAFGGGIYNTNKDYFSITGDFVKNRTKSTGGYTSAGGAIYNQGNIGQIMGAFIDNRAMNYNINTSTYGGAIYNTGEIVKIQGDFIGNRTEAEYNSCGGAIYNTGTLNNISANFLGNYSIATKDKAYGGAIYTTNHIGFIADSKELLFSGNYMQAAGGNKLYNAVYAKSDLVDIVLNFKIQNEGRFIFHDTISGSSYKNNTYYNIFVNGDKTGSIEFYNSIINAKNIDINGSIIQFKHGPYGKGELIHNDGKLTNLNINNATFDIANKYIEHINIDNFNADNGTNFLSIDIDARNFTADTISANNISGTINLIVNSLYDINIPNSDILFANTTGIGNKDSFKIYRVYGSPFMFDVVYKNSGIIKNWYLSMNSTKNPDYDNTSEPENPNPEQPDIPGTTPENPDKPDPDTPNKPQKPAEIIITKPKVYPEITAFAALPNALLEQTRMTANNIVFTNKSGLWLQPILIYADNNNNVDTKSSIKGAEFGFSKNANNDWSMGVFGSVLSGNHELNGNGQSFYSEAASTIDTTSILFGGYIKRSPKRNFNLFLSVYGGKLDSEINTDDGITIDNSATQLSAKAIFGYDFNIANKFVVGPQIGTGFTHLTIEDSKDDFGKIATFDALNHLYADAGLKIELRLNNIDLYLKPAYMLTYNKGNEFQTNGIGSIQTIEDINIIKIDGGIDLKLTNNSYANIAVNYLIGDNYSSLGCTAGLSYKF